MIALQNINHPFYIHDAGGIFTVIGRNLRNVPTSVKVVALFCSIIMPAVVIVPLHVFFPKIPVCFLAAWWACGIPISLYFISDCIRAVKEAFLINP
jgi:hypothetical protein